MKDSTTKTTFHDDVIQQVESLVKNHEQFKFLFKTCLDQKQKKVHFYSGVIMTPNPCSSDSIFDKIKGRD